MKTLLLLLMLLAPLAFAELKSYTWDPPPEGQSWDSVAIQRVTEDAEGLTYETLGTTETPEQDTLEVDVAIGDRLVARAYTREGGSSLPSDELVVEAPPGSPQNLRLIIKISTNLQDFEEVKIDPDKMFMTASLEPIK